MKPVGTLKKTALLPSQRRRVLAEALVALAGASAAISLKPVRKVVAMAPGSKRRPRTADEERSVRDCVWAVKLWGKRVPWRAVCFQQGLALHLMLRRRGIPSLLHYGVRQEQEKGVAAHVWVSVDGSVLIGGETADEFACLAVFPAA